MKIGVELYSRLREIVGAKYLEVVVREGDTVNDLFGRLADEHPGLRDFEESVLFGIGVDFVDRQQVLADGDCVAVMPPVQGG